MWVVVAGCLVWLVVLIFTFFLCRAAAIGDEQMLKQLKQLKQRQQAHPPSEIAHEDVREGSRQD